MHPLMMETLAQQRLRNLRPGQLPDVPEHLRDDVWAAWALSYSGPSPLLRWLRRLIAAVRANRVPAPAVTTTTVTRPTTTIARTTTTQPTAVKVAGRPAALIGCRP